MGNFTDLTMETSVYKHSKCKEFKIILNSLTMEERTESLKYGDGTEAGVLSETELHEHEREPD